MATAQIIFRTALSSIGTAAKVVGINARILAGYGYAFATPFAIASHITNGNLTTGQKAVMTGLEIAFAIGGIALAGLSLPITGSIATIITIGAGVGYTLITYFGSSAMTNYFENKNRRKRYN